MIIFGVRGMTTTKERGEFHCPQCNVAQQFRQRRVRQFFHLYFIPLIPVKTFGEYVECNGCKSTYEPQVREYNPEAERQLFIAQYQLVIRRIMVMIMMADGVIDENEIKQIQSIYHEIAGVQLSDDDVKKEIKIVHESSHGIKDYIGMVGHSLNEFGKEQVVKAAYEVSMADGILQDEEELMIAEIAEALEISSAHLKGILGEVKKPGAIAN